MDVKAPFLCVKQTYSGQLNCEVLGRPEGNDLTFLIYLFINKISISAL